MTNKPPARDVKDMFNNGDWCNSPWFLSSTHEEIFSQTPFSLNMRKKAAIALQRAFPPEICLEMLQRGFDGGIILGLFRPFGGYVFPLLKLGLDLDVLTNDVDETLLNRLHHRTSYHPTAFEVSVWANLKQKGYSPTREPKGPGKKKPDFEIFLGQQRYILELKAFLRPEVDELAVEADAAFQRLPDMSAPGLLVTIRPSADFANKSLTLKGRAEIQSSWDDIVRAFSQRADDILRTGPTPGIYEAAPYGYIEISNTSYIRGAYRCLFVPELSPWEQRKRFTRDAEEKCKQLPAGASGILMYLMREIKEPEQLTLELQRKATERPSRFKNCNFVIACGAMPVEEGVPAPIAIFIPMPWHTPTSAEINLAQTLAQNMPHDWLRPPERTFRSKLATTELRPGLKTSIKWNTSDINSDVVVEVSNIEPDKNNS